MAPSPTAEATRLIEPLRTSPAANTPGRLVSSRYGSRASSRQASPPSAERPNSLPVRTNPRSSSSRSEEHTSELQSRQYLVCRLLLEKKKKQTYNNHTP